MKQRFPFSLACTISFLLFSLTLMAQGTLAPTEDRSKILAGYSEEWSIYGANYNVANCSRTMSPTELRTSFMPLETWLRSPGRRMQLATLPTTGLTTRRPTFPA